MANRYLIGIDLGTTMAKCGVYDISGSVVAEAQEEMHIHYPRSGEAEQDALEFYEVTCRLIKRCLQTPAIESASVAAVGIDSQMGGIMSVDKNFNPVTYYDTPLDSRSAGENIEMHDRFGDLILENNGCLSTYGNKILYWRKRNEWGDIVKFIQPSAFVAGKLAGFSGDDAYMDETFICFSGFSDLKRGAWSEELCSRMDVDMDKLPRIIKSTEIIGEVCGDGVEDTGLPRGTPIAAGCGDQVAGFVGAGIQEPGQMVDVAGTACILGACIPDYRFDAEHRTLACLKSAIGDNYYLISVVLGGRTHNWFMEEFYQEKATELGAKGESIYEYLDDLAEKIPPASDGLLSINYLQGRFFPPEPYVRGVFLGHTWAHSKIHFYRAILESIAYDHYITRGIIRELVPELKLQAVTAIGSGANSRLWMQIKADVLQVPYESLLRSDLSTLGSAVIAGHAVDLFRDGDADIDEFVRRKQNKVVQPVVGADGYYKRSIEIYGELLRALKPIYERMAGRVG